MGVNHGRERAEADERVESNESVHVRTLGVVDTFRWSWEMLTHRLELVGFASAVALLSVLGVLGTTPPPADAPQGTAPEFAWWVLPAYLVYFLAVVVVWGVSYSAAEDAVKGQRRPLSDHVVRAVKRAPVLLVVAVPMWLVSVLGLFLLVLPGIYLFHRLLLSYPACVIDGKGPLAGLKAGWSAGGGNVLKILAFDLLYLGLVAASNLVASIFGQYTLVGGVIAAGATAVLLPLFGLGFGHLYLEGSRNG